MLLAGTLTPASERWDSEPSARREVCGVEIHPRRSSPHQLHQLLKEQQTLSREWDEFGAMLKREPRGPQPSLEDAQVSSINPACALHHAELPGPLHKPSYTSAPEQRQKV